VNDLWATKREDVVIIDRTISFQDFQPMCSWSTNVTDRRTDGQTDDMWFQDRACSVMHHAVIKRLNIGSCKQRHTTASC